jgi:hypothetical protein
MRAKAQLVALDKGYQVRLLVDNPDLIEAISWATPVLDTTIRDVLAITGGTLLGES